MLNARRLAPPSERRRVLLLTQNLNVWGAQRQLVELAKQLDPARWDVRVGTLEPDGPLAAELGDIPVHDFARRWRWDLSPVRRIARYLRDERIDVVHSFMFLPNFYARLAGKAARTPAVISSVRSSMAIDGWPRYLLDVAGCVLCDAMIANSEAGRAHYLRWGGLRGRTVVVRNGLPRRPSLSESAPEAFRRRWGLQRFDHLIGMVAALEWRKDHPTLIQALRVVLERHPRAGLVLAGDGSRLQELQALAGSLGIASGVVFAGQVGSPDVLYGLLDVYVQASYPAEGISNSVIEAMSHGVPVVATDVGGNREAVVDGVTGRLVPPRDPAALGDVLADLLSQPAKRRAMGRASVERVRSTFSLESMVDATSAVYDAVLSVR